MQTSARNPWPIISVIALVVVALTAGLLCGPASLADDGLRAALLDLRAARSACAGLAGAALAVAGVVVQGLFRNPLAGPSVLGTTSGAALGGQLALYAQAALATLLPAWVAPEMALPIGCTLGAGAALGLLLALVRRAADPVAVLLAGFALAVLCSSLGAVVTVLSQESWQLARAMLAFSFGGVEGRDWRHVALAVPLVVVGVLAAWGWARPLDLLLCGDDEAAALGCDVRRARGWLLVWTGVLTAAAVAIGGGVPFVGLIVPHAVRLLVGAEHRRLIPLAALVGGAFTVLCDVAVRLLPGALPLGVVTGLIGAPIFLWLFARERREGRI